MAMMLKLVTAPVANPVVLAEIKEYLRLDPDDTTFDNDLTALIAAARTQAENFQNRAYMARTYDLFFDCFPRMPLKLPMPPLQSVTSIKYTDEEGTESTIDSDDYIMDTASEPGRIAFKVDKYWPDVTLQAVNGVVIRYVAGDDNPPENVKLAIKFFVGFRFENPETEELPDAFYNLLWPDRMVPV